MSDFYWSPSYGFSVNKAPKLKEAEFGDGYSQRSSRGINNNAGRWSLSFTNVSDSVADSIIDFLDSHADGSSFTWTPPGEVTEIVVYCKQYSKTYSGFGTNNVSADFTQVYGE